MKTKAKIIHKRAREIGEIFEASKQIEQGYFYVGKLKDIIKKRKSKNLNTDK